jgi:hypothetical protein
MRLVFRVLEKATVQRIARIRSPESLTLALTPALAHSGKVKRDSGNVSFCWRPE